ncbi:hypothetical protein KI387_009903, partial [Taxus chinensis]
AKSLDYIESMKLEIERLKLNLSAAERDRALLSIGRDPATIDPNRLLEPSYMVQLRKAAQSLTMLSELFFEDKKLSAIGLETEKEDAFEFWNVNGFEDHCADPKCEVRAEKKQIKTTDSEVTPEIWPELLVCSKCARKVCTVCTTGKGSMLLANNSSLDAISPRVVPGQGGSSHGGGTTFHSLVANKALCKTCCPQIILDALLLDRVKVLSSLRQRSRVKCATSKSLQLVVGYSSESSSVDLGKQNETFDVTGKDQSGLHTVFKGESSLAEYPHASLLYPVETAEGSAPSLSLLAPVGLGSAKSYWRAPPSASSVEFAIVLATVSVVSGVAILVSPCGYTTLDPPLVQLWCSNMVMEEERTFIGKWDVRSAVASSSQLYGPENLDRIGNVPRHLMFNFRNPVKCRIIWMKLSLRRPGSSSVGSIERGFDLLSLEGSTSLPPSRRSSFGSQVAVTPYIHAKRILVVGKHLRDDLRSDALFQSSEKDKIEEFNRKAFPIWSLQSMVAVTVLLHYSVQIEAERLCDGDRVLEQYISPMAPTIAGYRLDALCAVKPYKNHSPISSEKSYVGNFVNSLEAVPTNPPVLFIHVSALQVKTIR